VSEPVISPSSPPPSRTAWLVAALLALLALLAIGLAWDARQRLRTMEKELVRRAQESQAQAAEARVLARQAEDAARQAVAKVALVDARVADATVQRSQVEELLDSLTRAHDDGVLGEVEALVRSAQQQSAITGSAEPLLIGLRQVEERLARRNEPKVERVRRAVARDIDRLKASGATDPAALAGRVDEVLRGVDELPLRAQPRDVAATAAATSVTASAPASAAAAGRTWTERVGLWWAQTRSRVWDEVRALVRVTRIDTPEAALLAPEQGDFLRQHLKLRLLNAKLALLARHFDSAQTELREAQALLERYYDRDARRVAAHIELLRQLALHTRVSTPPRPDETLAALAAAAR
jgi:uroporphyrin-3 C-methyltransferase